KSLVVLQVCLRGVGFSYLAVFFSGGGRGERSPGELTRPGFLFGGGSGEVCSRAPDHGGPGSLRYPPKEVFDVAASSTVPRRDDFGRGSSSGGPGAVLGRTGPPAGT